MVFSPMTPLGGGGGGWTHIFLGIIFPEPKCLEKITQFDVSSFFQKLANKQPATRTVHGGLDDQQQLFFNGQYHSEIEHRYCT